LQSNLTNTRDRKTYEAVVQKSSLCTKFDGPHDDLKVYEKKLTPSRYRVPHSVQSKKTTPMPFVQDPSGFLN